VARGSEKEKKNSVAHPPFTDLTHYAQEQGAWAVGASIAQALGMKSLAPHGGGRDFQVGNRGWKTADIDTLRSRGIQNVLNYYIEKYGNGPMQTTFSGEHMHDFFKAGLGPLY